MDKRIYIDLFAGCGGLSLGFFNSGLWKALFAVEKDPNAFETLHHNLIASNGHFLWPDWLPKANIDIKELSRKYRQQLKELRGKIDLVTGGPPCQGFSMAGRRDPSDLRNQLVHSYLDIISLVKPKALFFENVEGFTLPFGEDKSKRFSTEVEQKLDQLGYHVKARLLDFSNYGVPQKRKRYIIIGLHKDHFSAEVDFFGLLDAMVVSFLKERGLTATTNIQQAISDLERDNGTYTIAKDRFSYGYYGRALTKYQRHMRKNAKNKPDSHRFAQHSAPVESRYAEIISLGLKSSLSIRTKYGLKKNSIKLLEPELCSPTLTTLPDDYIHYSEPRILTVREYARIQSFNDWFEFKGKYTTGGIKRTQEVPRYSQIGNAIPPLFAEQCAITFHSIFNGEFKFQS